MSDEQAVTSEPVPADDGDTVTIRQQNVGPGNQVGGGEFKNSRGTTPDEAASEQSDLDREQPVSSERIAEREG